MLTPDEFILNHAYDPVKAHNYYIRTRQLKGRKKGLIQPELKTGKTSPNNSASPKLSPVKPQETITVKRQAEVQARVEILRKKLTILETILKQLVSEATGSSTKKTKTTKSSSTRTNKTSSAGSKRKPLTATQKQEAAKKQKIRYKKTHPNAGKVTKQERQQKIEEVKRKIEEIRNQLKAAIANARNIAASKPAATGRRNS